MDTQPKKPKISKKAIVVIIVLAIILAGVIIWQKKSIAPESEEGMFPSGVPAGNDQTPEPQDDKTAAINEDLEGINLEALEDEFKDIDADLNNL